MLSADLPDAVGFSRPASGFLGPRLPRTSITIVRGVGLLEREHELGVLAGAVEDALAGRGSLALVSGEAGIGKSPLVRELRERTGERVSFLRSRGQHCGVGAAMFAPAGTPHTFRVESDTARMLFLSTPAGVEDYVRALAEPAVAVAAATTRRTTCSGGADGRGGAPTWDDPLRPATPVPWGGHGKGI